MQNLFCRCQGTKSKLLRLCGQGVVSYRVGQSVFKVVSPVCGAVVHKRGLAKVAANCAKFRLERMLGRENG
jgi:hypothetical protein